MKAFCGRRRSRPDPGARSGLPRRHGRAFAAIGGEGSLTHFAALLDRDGDGNPVDDVLDMAKGQFGKS